MCNYFRETRKDFQDENLNSLQFMKSGYVVLVAPTWLLFLRAVSRRPGTHAIKERSQSDLFILTGSRLGSSDLGVPGESEEARRSDGAGGELK